ncbi:MAG: RNA polymerase sigma factor [Planctomycetes bacterium]|nr:RNA polymerase sigma factor [Planctomycetota bacterium]
MASPVTQDRQDLAALLERLAPRVQRLARQLCGPDADDAAQEVFRELGRALPKFRGESSPETFAHVVARRVLLRFARRKRRRAQREPTASELALDLDERAVTGFANEPFSALLANERAARVREAIASLSPPLRDVLVLRHLEELSYAEIATTLELPLGTVKSRIAAATLRLAERLQRQGDGA